MEECNHSWKPLGISYEATGEYETTVKATIYCEHCGQIRSQEV